MRNQIRIMRCGLLTIVASTVLMSCQLGRYVFYNFADIKDHKKFQSRPLTADTSPFIFQSTNKGKVPKHINNIPFDKYLEDNKTVAFLIIKNDSIRYENYFKGYNKESIVPSFSMAKSVTSILIGCAIDEGLIKSVDEPITNYIPELKKNGFDKVTIKHLLQMTSGIKFNESYVNPFGDAASFYYGLNLRKKIGKMKLKTEPGTTFEYTSGNTQLLGLVLERSLNGKTITSYLQEKIWSPLEMENDASWSIDRKKNGLEKTFCCLNATARDFAKIGRLYKNKGNWNGKQIVSQKWVEESTKLDTSEGSANFYQYQWWLPTPNEDFMAEGILGQFIYVNPKKDLIIVRLGKDEGKADWWAIFTSLAKLY
ncbi:serine hydrolase [Flavobacterium sp.]|uniref:serine hydrolase domain-containing protein n=1 Tax=Flavobacterium sp. TaxID=239 RepID=UPI0022C982B9|nr:serine hydrolase [Flavobacterium sp.]MCZ8145582.1 serine hydrolase [Flavobacterium sp.]MCZ8366537.1 serine hydrolase [Flavobacterium sp.]